LSNTISRARWRRYQRVANGSCVEAIAEAGALFDAPTGVSMCDESEVAGLPQPPACGRR
jgi:hypothetical protein